MISRRYRENHGSSREQFSGNQHYRYNYASQAQKRKALDFAGESISLQGHVHIPDVILSVRSGQIRASHSLKSRNLPTDIGGNTMALISWKLSWQSTLLNVQTNATLKQVHPSCTSSNQSALIPNALANISTYTCCRLKIIVGLNQGKASALWY